MEVDFMSPSSLKDVYLPPFKQTLPLLYEFNVVSDANNPEISSTKQIPSIYVSEFKGLAEEMEKLSAFDKTKILRKKSKSGIWKKTNGYQSFIIAWDKGLFTKRNVSSMRTTIEWANHYENLKRYEIDHKSLLDLIFGFSLLRMQNRLRLGFLCRLKTELKLVFIRRKLPADLLFSPLA